MARIVADRGIQDYQKPSGGGTVRYNEFDLDCSCTLRIDERYLFRVGHMDIMSRIQQVADAHICEIEVFMVHTEAAQRLRDRAQQARLGNQFRNTMTIDPPLRYMGVDVTPQSDEAWLTMWGSAERWRREVIDSFRVDPPRRRSPAEVERSIRENPAPRQAPEEQVRAATAQLRGVEVPGVVVDELVRFEAAGGIGFKPPEKKSDPTERPDRFLLIELD